MTEDGIPRSSPNTAWARKARDAWLYAYVSPRMREELTAALQVRWEDSLRQRARIGPRSPVPLLDELLSPLRRPADHPRWETRPKMISQIPPNKEEDPVRQVG